MSTRIVHPKRVSAVGAQCRTAASHQVKGYEPDVGVLMLMVMVMVMLVCLRRHGTDVGDFGGVLRPARRGIILQVIEPFRGLQWPASAGMNLTWDLTAVLEPSL